MAAPSCAAPQGRATARTVRPTVVAILEQLEPAPAFVINHLANLHEVRRADLDADTLAAQLSQAAGAELTDR
ncbi:MAG: hypothetical protein ACRDTA_28440 [Pseudonocardiaceae bacterium]